MSRRSRQQPVKTHPFRHWSVALLVMAGLGGLFWRAAILQTTERAHLEKRDGLDLSVTYLIWRLGVEYLIAMESHWQ